ncbi:hypothetical protein ACIQOU_33450 [Streptomyces sp. NPDC091279]|uniref:hypothetical protein n=1 Tax=unclassified Streptomyces TaxID=2593676 RepID=UPI003828C006
MNARIAAVALVSAALVAGSATVASAAPAPKPTISLSASTTHAKKGQAVAFSGKVSGLKDGSKVVLQEKVGAKWIATPVSTKVKKGAYRLTDKFKATETLRVVDGKATSKPVTVTVR